MKTEKIAALTTLIRDLGQDPRMAAHLTALWTAVRDLADTPSLDAWRLVVTLACGALRSTAWPGTGDEDNRLVLALVAIAATDPAWQAVYESLWTSDAENERAWQDLARQIGGG